ncbi:unnamed protein product [Dibothriocephalus latus]|uniref:Uncharacterized protein n=1 Tax=Dibothriocephalus latus TaxID=60516 RepID=A0A3P6QQV2_DIBLA|nr:unnamed protein product [Dibothriocephalus latus]
MELDVIRYAVKASSAAHRHLMRNVKPGMYQFQAESLFLNYCYFHVLEFATIIDYLEGLADLDNSVDRIVNNYWPRWDSNPHSREGSANALPLSYEVPIEVTNLLQLDQKCKLPSLMMNPRRMWKR